MIWATQLVRSFLENSLRMKFLHSGQKPLLYCKTFGEIHNILSHSNSETKLSPIQQFAWSINVATFLFGYSTVIKKTQFFSKETWPDQGFWKCLRMSPCILIWKILSIMTHNVWWYRSSLWGTKSYDLISIVICFFYSFSNSFISLMHPFKRSSRVSYSFFSE